MRKVIINEVSRLIKTYHTRNPFEIAEMMNIEIVYHDLGNLKGYYFYQSRFKFIVINENISEELIIKFYSYRNGRSFDCSFLFLGELKQ